jgi:hypothetical protein
MHDMREGDFAKGFGGKTQNREAAIGRPRCRWNDNIEVRIK